MCPSTVESVALAAAAQLRPQQDGEKQTVRVRNDRQNDLYHAPICLTAKPNRLVY